MTAATAFEHFSWLSKEQRAQHDNAWLELCSQARDITAGVAELVAMIEAEDIDAELADKNFNPLPRLVPANTRGHLQRLAITSLGMITERIDKAIEDDCKMTPDRAAWLARAAARRAADVAHAAAQAAVESAELRAAENTETPVKGPVHSPVTPEQVRKALACIDADMDGATWRIIGMAVKAALGDAGFKLWDTWSRGNLLYRPGQVHDIWEGFRMTDAVGMAALGKLFELAAENGYRQPEALLGDAPQRAEGSNGKKSRTQRVPRRPKIAPAPASSGGLN